MCVCNGFTEVESVLPTGAEEKIYESVLRGTEATHLIKFDPLSLKYICVRGECTGLIIFPLVSFCYFCMSYGPCVFVL